MVVAAPTIPANCAVVELAPPVGALIVGFVRAAAISIYPEFEVLAIYVLVIAVLILRPRGLLGKAI